MANIVKTLLGKLSNKTKSSIAYKSLKLFFSKPQNILFFILIDLIFITAMAITNGLMGLLLNSFNLTSILLILIITFTNIALVLLFYSIAKKKTLDIIFNYKNRIAMEWHDLKQFTIINIITYFVLFLTAIIIGSVIYFTIKEEYFQNLVGIFVAILVIITYAFINITHIKYSQNKKLNKSLGNGWQSLSELWCYKPLIFSGIVFLIYLLLMSAISVLVTLIIFKFTQNTSILEIYTMIITIIGMFLIYILHLFNRIYYLNLIEKQQD
jgi:hypothetical protein